jgi:flagellar biosynthetic protein FliQ
MTETDVIDICRTAIITLVVVAGPVLVIMTLVGTAISVFQAVTQISEQTLSMVPKLLITFGLSILLMPFMLGQLTEFFERQVIDRIVEIGSGSPPGTPGPGG